MNKKTFSPSQKASVALTALKGNKTFSEISSLYQVHPTQIRKWKNIVQEGLPNLFTDKRKKKELEREQLIDELYKIIGKRDTELNWLKKKLSVVEL